MHSLPAPPSVITVPSASFTFSVRTRCAAVSGVVWPWASWQVWQTAFASAGFSYAKATILRTDPVTHAPPNEESTVWLGGAAEFGVNPAAAFFVQEDASIVLAAGVQPPLVLPPQPDADEKRGIADRRLGFPALGQDPLPLVTESTKP